MALLQCTRFLPTLKQIAARGVTKPTRQASPSERVIASLFPATSSYPGTWGGRHYEEVYHFKNWTYVVIDLIASKIASLVPNVAYVSSQEKPGRTVKACQRGLMNMMGRGFGGTPYIGGQYQKNDIGSNEHGYKPYKGEVYGQYVGTDRYHANELTSNGMGSSFLTIGEYLGKALSVVKPHENLEPLEGDHHLRSLIDNPNPVDTFFDLEYELSMFEELCGVSYEWIPKNAYGKPAERWCIPSHWVWPVTGGGRELKYSESTGQLISYYQVRPWGGMGSAGSLSIPADEMIMTRWKSPINKIDGWSRLSAGAQWIDSEESITASRWAQFQNVARPELWIELGAGYEDVNDDRIARVEAKIRSKLQGEYNYGTPLITPPGAKVTPLSFSPANMAYMESEEQIRDQILSLWKVPKTAIGINTDMTYGSILATLMGLCTNCLNPRLTMRGQTRTKYLASRFDETVGHGRETSYGHGPGSSGGRKVKIWYDDCVPADPQQVNSDLAEDRAQYAITPNEVRALRGRKPYRFGGDDPWAQGPGGISPYPVNTQEDLTELAGLIAPMTQAQDPVHERENVDEQGQPIGGEAAGSASGATGQGVSTDGTNSEGETPPTGEEQKPLVGIAHPNGKPSKQHLKQLAAEFLKVGVS